MCTCRANRSSVRCYVGMYSLIYLHNAIKSVFISRVNCTKQGIYLRLTGISFVRLSHLPNLYVSVVYDHS